MSDADAVSLHRLITRGDLDALLAHIRAEEPLRVKHGNLKRLKSALEFAVEAGFYSMVKLLLEETLWSEEELEASLEKALWNQRDDLVGLLLEHDAPFAHISFYTIFRTMNMETVSQFLDLGLDPCKDNAFAQILDDTRAKPLLRFYKEHRERFPCLDDQVAMALVSAVQDCNARWTALLIWAGADLDREVPWSLRKDVDCDPAYKVTARGEALALGDFKFLESVKIPIPPEMQPEVVEKPAKKKSLKSLIQSSTPEELNSGENGSCPALESLVDRPDTTINTSDYRHDGKEDEAKHLKDMDMLLNAGAKFLPSNEQIKSLRRSLLTHQGEYIVQVIRLLLYTKEATTIHHIWELCRTDTMRVRLRVTEDPLWEEIVELAIDAGIEAATRFGRHKKGTRA